MRYSLSLDTLITFVQVPVAKDHVTCDHVTEEEKVLSSIVDAVR